MAEESMVSGWNPAWWFRILEAPKMVSHNFWGFNFFFVDITLPTTPIWCKVPTWLCNRILIYWAYRLTPRKIPNDAVCRKLFAAIFVHLPCHGPAKLVNNLWIFISNSETQSRGWSWLGFQNDISLRSPVTPACYCKIYSFQFLATVELISLGEFPVLP